MEYIIKWRLYELNKKGRPTEELYDTVHTGATFSGTAEEAARRINSLNTFAELAFHWVEEVEDGNMLPGCKE